MRRALSISLILLFWMPALAALLPGSEDARLPFCCRRGGAHHCDMDSGQNTGSGLTVKAPSRCAQFPAVLPATIFPAFITAATPTHWTALVSGVYSLAARREAARAGRIRAQLDRGPPPSALA